MDYNDDIKRREEDLEKTQGVTAEDQAQMQFSERNPKEEGTPEGRFDSPDFHSQAKGTSSAVDLSIRENEDKMFEELREFRNMDKQDHTRQKLEDRWYQKYYGMSKEENDRRYAEAKARYSNPIMNFHNKLQNLTALSAGATSDIAMDIVGVLPGLAPIDNWYDKVTRSPNPLIQNVRRMLSIVVPSIWSGGKVAGQLQKLPAEMPKVQKALIATGAFSAQEAAVIGLSDVGEDDNILKTVSDTFPGVFGPKGSVPIPNWAKTLDSDSPRVRKYKNMLDTAGLSIVGTTLGAYITIKGGKKILGWMEPLDDTAVRYKQKSTVEEADVEKLIKIQEIDTQLSLGSDNISRQVENELIAERERLVQSLDNVDDLEKALDAVEANATKEETIAAQRKKEDLDPNEFDPDVTPVLDEAGNARQSVPPGNVARNIADTTAIKKGISEGDPAPVITEAMRTKGLMVGSTSRDAVLGVAEQARDTGRFNALVDGFRFTSEQMNETAWAIYKDIVNPNVSLEEVRQLFATNKDTKSMLLGRFNVEYINEEQARAAAFAMRDLTDRYLGREIAQSSARVMDTLGREAATLAQTVQELQPFVDDPRAMDLIIDKMQFLMDEYALNKYISGWQLRNKNWFDQVPPDKNINEVINTLAAEFRSAENAIHAKNLKFTETLVRLSKENPLAMRPLVDAYAHTNGDVDSLVKLQTWASEQITPTGMLKSPDPQALNLFTRSAWGVIYNNVLSGISAFRAGIGNTSQLILKPITAILGHGVLGLTDDFEGLKKALYYNGAVHETNRRALSDAWTMMKKAHKDPEMMIKAYRKDISSAFQEDKSWEILEDMRAVWEAEGNYGKILQYDTAKNLKDMAKLPYLRYGMTGMVFPDVFTNTHLAHYLSRMRAYDDVFDEFGFADWKKIGIAEKKHYQNMFDENGLVKDNALKALSGEVALNLDDGLATWINKGTTAYPIAKFMFMFPRTGSNYVKNALSWTPMSLIPGINKYSKTIYASTDDDIARALAEHGVDMATTPNARELFKNLRAEYIGRMAFSGLLTKTMWDVAMAGNIRGNGHYNASRRNKERDQLGYIPKTINIGGKWVSYKGIIGVDPVLSILGDMAYYARDIDETFAESWSSKVMWTIAATFLNETPLQGLEPLVAAANGDIAGWSRLVANSARSLIPQSGALGVLSNAITSTQKDIEADIIKYIQNKTPIASSFLPEQIDIWTGQPLNDIDNPFLRVLNSISPIKVSGTQEPWRQWLLTTGWDGLSRLKKDSTGSYTYTPEERERIYQYIGEQQLWKKIEKLRKNKKYAKEVSKLRLHRSTGDDLKNERIKLETRKLPVFRELDKIIRDAQKEAEYRFITENTDIENTILRQRYADAYMKEGQVDKAIEQQKQELLEYGGTRQ